MVAGSILLGKSLDKEREDVDFILDSAFNEWFTLIDSVTSNSLNFSFSINKMRSFISSQTNYIMWDRVVPKVVETCSKYPQNVLLLHGDYFKLKTIEILQVQEKTAAPPLRS